MSNGIPQHRLRQIVSQPDTVLFVGAGVASWSGLPTWPDLIAELADFVDSRGCSSHLVRRELERGDLLQAASFAFDLLTPQDRAAFLRGACRHGSAQPSTLHRRLVTLGPRCFITTNYDKLLEQALIAERAEIAFQVVNNTNLVETATIVQSRARDYVFKPHGDIDTSDSVVLTREQYRALRGEKRHAFEAFKTLLASRPVLFVGFGLRDPDFLLIKDTLATIYHGAAQDHHALVADVDEQEIAYWRNNYGIHLHTYKTDVDAHDPSTRHAALLPLLDEIAIGRRPRTAGSQSTAATRGDRLTATILRHAQKMLQLAPAPGVEILPLTGSPVAPGSARAPSRETSLAFLNGDAVTGLLNNRQRLLLSGPPGAGKTFTVRATIARLAEDAIEGATRSEAELVRVPTYVDLRDYAGDLWKMVVESFPMGFPLEQFLRAGRIAFFVDGLNEVPARAVEDDSLHQDLSAFLERVGSCSAVLVTRFGDEHNDLELPGLTLDAIPSDYVRSQLERRGVPAATISAELLTLLGRPVFYRFCVGHGLWDVRTPHAIYTAVLARLADRCFERFGVSLDFTSLFGRVAFASIEAGDQLITVDALTSELSAKDAQTLDAHTLVNWLLADGVLIPRLGGRVSFFHHSVVEYLAAHELADRYRADERALLHCLQSLRWDHAVLLTLGFLEPAEQRSFFDEVMATDAVLALRALAFVDDDWEQWTTEALRGLLTADLSWREDFELSDVLDSLRVAVEHEPHLLELGKRAGHAAGVAIGRTLELGAPERARRTIDALFARADDGDRGIAIASYLKDTIDVGDLEYLLTRLREHPVDVVAVAMIASGEEVDAIAGPADASGIVFRAFELETLRRRLGCLQDAPLLVRMALLAMIRYDDSDDAIKTTGELLESDPAPAARILHSQIAFGEGCPDLSCLEPKQIGPMLLDTEVHCGRGWALATLQLLADRSPDWMRWVGERAVEQPPGVIGATLWHIAQHSDRFFATLSTLVGQELDWSTEPVGALQMIKNVAWDEHEELFTALLRERDDELACHLIETIHRWSVSDGKWRLSLDLGDIVWWVDWIAEPGDERDFVRERLGRLIAAGSSDQQVPTLLQIFADGTLEQRRVLAYDVLGYIRGIRLGDLTPATIAWALDDLRTEHSLLENIDESVLAAVATEELVEQTLLPLLATAEEPLRSHLVVVMRQAGERHRRRYVTTRGEVIG